MHNNGPSSGGSAWRFVIGLRSSLALRWQKKGGFRHDHCAPSAPTELPPNYPGRVGDRMTLGCGRRQHRDYTACDGRCFSGGLAGPGFHAAILHTRLGCQGQLPHDLRESRKRRRAQIGQVESAFHGMYGRGRRPGYTSPTATTPLLRALGDTTRVAGLR